MAASNGHYSPPAYNGSYNGFSNGNTGDTGLEVSHPPDAPNSRSRSGAEPASILDPGPDESKLLEIISRVKQFKIEDTYDMPQIVVCGYQSTGKSSVLEAITGIPFPRDISTCTKCITQVTLLTSERACIGISIQPPENSSEERKKRLLEFSRNSEISALNRIGSLLKEADEAIRAGPDHDKVITRDIVHIKISGPNTKPLELFDLPGLVGRDNGSDMKQEAESIMRSYMQKPQAIILAVVRANGDSNGPETGILEWCQKEYDVEGKRTICVLTHPDQSADRTNAWVSVLKGGSSAREFGPGGDWHVLRNWPPEVSPENRDEKEEEFFRQLPWSAVSNSCRGARALRDRLRNRLFSKLKERLPDLYSHLQGHWSHVKLELQRLGEKEVQTEDQVRKFKAKLDQIRQQALACSKGDYEYSVQTFSYTKNNEEVFLKSRIVDEGEQFRDNINRYGHTWESYISPLALPRDLDLKSLSQPSRPLPEGWGLWQKTFANMDMEIDEMKKLLGARRKQAASWYPEPDRINEFFWSMSEYWRKITEWHIKGMVECCKKYAQTMVPYGFSLTRHQGDVPGFINHDHIGKRYLVRYVWPNLNKRRDGALAELQRIEQDRQMAIFSFDLSYLGQQRDYSHAQDFEGSMKANRALGGLDTGQGDGAPLAPRNHAVARNGHTQEDHHRMKAREFVQAAVKHYEIARAQWIANVMSQVVDRHLIRHFNELFPDVPDGDKIVELIEEDPALGEKRKSVDAEKRAIESLLDLLQEQIDYLP